jgi:peroxiredoxin
MPVVIAALIALAVGLVLNLVITAGLIRRLREVHRAMMDWKERVSKSNPLLGGLHVGELVPPFEARTLDGSSIALSDFSGSTWVVGFFSAGCSSCHEYLPQLRSILQGSRRKVRSLIVIAGDRNAAADLIRLADGAGPVVVEEDGAISTAFRLGFFPTVFLIDEDGRSAFGSNSVEDLRDRLVA